MRSYLSALLLAANAVQGRALRNVSHSSLDWGSCGDLDSSVPISCASLTVPLDYTDQYSNKTLSLDLIRVRATTGPSKGSIIVNFGGPGQDGVNSLAGSAGRLLNMTGGQHDLVSFDPRGTGKTLPFECYETQAEFQTALSRVPERLGNASSTATGRIWVDAKMNAEKCYDALADTYGTLVGTAFVARDIMRIVDALDEDGLLRFWGMSYGTILGATTAAMFPDRIDKLILDGVVNFQEYYHSHDLEQLHSADNTLKGFLNGCVAAPEECALARDNKTANSIADELFNTLEDLKTNPIPLGDMLIDYSLVKNMLFNQLYVPTSYPSLARQLDQIMTRNLTESDSSAGAVTSSAQALFGIKCSDKFVRASTLDEVRPIFAQLQTTSKWFGDILASTESHCMQWQMDAKERYKGGFDDVATRNPVLLIGNTYDPTTPLLSAHNVSSSLRDSVVLEQQGYGHGTMAQISTCTSNAIRDYFVDGVLPKPGSVCPVDYRLFHEPLPN